MIAEPIKLDAWIVHRADGDFAICHCPQPEGSRRPAYTACWNDVDPDLDSPTFGLGDSADDAIDALKGKTQQECWP